MLGAESWGLKSSQSCKHANMLLETYSGLRKPEVIMEIVLIKK